MDPLTIAAHNFMVPFQKWRHISLVSHGTAVAVGVVCLEVGWIES